MLYYTTVYIYKRFTKKKLYIYTSMPMKRMPYINHTTVTEAHYTYVQNK